MELYMFVKTKFVYLLTLNCWKKLLLISIVMKLVCNKTDILTINSKTSSSLFLFFFRSSYNLLNK